MSLEDHSPQIKLSISTHIFNKRIFHIFFIIILITNCFYCKNKNVFDILKTNEIKINTNESSNSTENDKCYEKLNKEVLWALSALTNNVSEIYNQENIKTHFSFLAGTNYNELGSYDKCLQKADMRYFLSKLSMQQLNQTVSLFQGSCLPIECKDENALRNLENKLSKILNLTEENKLEIVDVENLNAKIIDFSITNYIILLVILLYLLISSGIVQKLLHDWIINHPNYNKFPQDKEEQGTQRFIINNDSSILSNRSYSCTSASVIPDSHQHDSENKIEKDAEKQILNLNPNNNEKSKRCPKLSDSDKIELEESYSYNLLQKFNCIYNYQKIFKAEPCEGTNNNSPNEFKFMDFIRTFLCYYIVILHSVVFIMDTPVRGIDSFIDKIKTLPFQLIVNASFIVDIFFTISAFFLGYLGLSKFNSGSSRVKFFFNLIAFRLIRMWPVVIANFVIFWKVIPGLNIFPDGPIFGLIFQREFGSCGKQWPFMFSFLTNFTYGLYEKVAPVCLGWYWYLPIDLQMYVVGVILIILYRKRVKLFYYVFSALIILGLILEIKCLLKLNYGMNLFLQGDIMSNFTEYYIKIYNRCSPFWIGFFFGISYFEYKNKISLQEKNRNNVNKNDYSTNTNKQNETAFHREEELELNLLHMFFHKLKTSRLASIIAFILSIVLMLFIIFIVYFSYDTVIPNWINFTYNFFSRKLFSFAFILFCFSILNGHLKLISNLMNSKIFNLPAKLSFSIYLCHPCIIKLSYYSTKSSFYLDFYQIFLFGIGFCVISTVYAFFLYLFFEVPFMNFKPERKHHGFASRASNRKISKEKEKMENYESDFINSNKNEFALNLKEPDSLAYNSNFNNKAN